MKTEISIKGNHITYDDNTLYKDIEEILSSRFTLEDLSDNKGLEGLHSPYLLKGMKEAVSRIKKAYENKERIVIFGDYDVDGVTSTSILMHFFKTIGLSASYRLPNRVKDGYGLKKYFIDELLDKNVKLIITVDCGTRDIDIIKYAKEKGIDVIVTDHHSVPEVISSEAIALINPKRKDCNYPFKGLSGAGVAYKLMMALAREYMEEEKYQKYLQETIDIAAIGTVADCMSLLGENRIIVREGLKQLKKSRSIGLRRLIGDKINSPLDADVFGFIIGPRLNAAGRLDTPYKAVNLILNNSETLEETIRDIENLNTKRKALTKEFYEKALDDIDAEENLIFYISSDIEHGIIGIIAGRLTESFHRPSIVLKDEGDKLVASCRSPDFFDIIGLLDDYKEYFIAYGGHRQAAGFSISKDRFEDFKKNILKKVSEEDFSNNKKIINVDKRVRLSDLGFKFLEKIEKFKPYGNGNPKPLFIIKDFEYEGVYFLGNGRDHIKFNNKYGLKILGFGWGDYYDEIAKSDNISIIFDIYEDEWMGNRGIMLKIVDIIIENK